MRRLRLAAVWLCVLYPWIAEAQEVMPSAWQYYIEYLTEEGEGESVDELLELYEVYSESPANLNDTVSGLAAFPFVSTLQRERLRAYIAMEGELLSVEELYVVNGFDSLTVELLRPLVRAVHEEGGRRLEWRDLVKGGRSNLVVGSGGTVEQARGYRDSIYEGDDLRLMWRYRYRYKDRVQLQLAGDKDPGEAFFAGSQKRGFDFYGFSLVVNDMGRWSREGTARSVYVKRAVLGQYHLQFGQGLTLWSGFGPWATLGTGISRNAQGLRPNGAFTEYGYMQGAAAALRLGEHWDVSVFGSRVDRDATLPRRAATDSTVDWVQSIYNSGYHRTATEIAKRGLLGEWLAGAHVEFRKGMMRAGMTGVATLLEHAIVPAEYVYNDNAFRGKNLFNGGLDFAYRHGRMLWFGEAVWCMSRLADSTALHVAPAVLAGCEVAFGSRHRMSGQVHYYSPTYHNLHANAIGQASMPQNEAGAGIYYQGRLMWGVDATARACWSYFPHMKYLVYAPSTGQEYSLMLARASQRVRGLSVAVRYRYRERGRNVTPSRMVNGVYLLEQTHKHQATVDVEYGQGAWKATARAGYAFYHGDVTEGNRGWVVYGDVQFRPKGVPLTAAARLSLFDVDDYEARMYAVESDFIYQYSSTLYQNEGCRFYLLLRYDISPNWNVGLKYGITAYADRDTFGSGYDQIDANHRQQWRVQLRLKW